MSLTLSPTTFGTRQVRRTREQTEDRAAVPGLVIGLFLAFVIAGTLVAGKVIAFASIPILVCAALYYASRNVGLAIAIFSAYSAMEGMYKYLSYFSQIIYVIKPLLLLLIAAIWAFRARHRSLPIAAPPLALLVILLVGWGFVTIFNPTGSGIASGSATFLVWYLAPALLFFIAYNGVRSVDQMSMLAYVLIAICTVVSVLACVQYAMGQSWTEAHLPGYEQVNQGEWWITNDKGSVLSTQWRPASTAAMGGGGGLWSQRGVIVAVALLLAGKLSTRMRLAMIACLLVNVVGTVVSGCRLYVIVAIVETFLLVVILPRNTREWSRNVGAFFLFILVAGVGTLIANSITGGTIVDRYSATLADPVGKYAHDRGGITWRADMMLRVVHAFPFGIGYQRGLDGGRQTESSGPVAINRDDEFNCLAGDMGIPGVAILCCIVGGILSVGWRSFAAAQSGLSAAPVGSSLRALAGISYVITIGNLIQFFGGPVLQGNDQFWITIGLLFAVPVIARRELSVATDHGRAHGHGAEVPT